MNRRRAWWDLIDDEKTGRLQASKVWLHIGNATATVAIVWKLLIDATQVDEALLFTYMGWLTGGYGFMYTATRRQDAGNTSMDTTETYVENKTGVSTGLVGDSGIDSAASGELAVHITRSRKTRKGRRGAG